MVPRGAERVLNAREVERGAGAAVEHFLQGAGRGAAPPGTP